ncbi:MAG: hypothetical protein ACKPKO_30910, partial [Candidatus Fonsibacter sp.]
LQSDDKSIGWSVRQSASLMNKSQQLYLERDSLGFLNVSHIHFVAWSLTHSCLDTLEIVAYTGK